MASRFMVGSALGAHLLLRPSHQRAISFGIIYRLGRPITGRPITGRPMWPLVPGSKAYSGSSPTPPLPEGQSSQSSGHKDKNWFAKNTKGLVIAVALFAATSVLGLLVYAIQEFWVADRGRDLQRDQHESARESAIFEKLEKGPEFREDIEDVVLRESAIKEVKILIGPTEKKRRYPLIIGEHGTGKTSLIQLAIESMDKDKPKGIVYVDLPLECNSEDNIVEAIHKGLGWNLDPVLDSNKLASIRKTLDIFSHVALKYREEHKKVPVLIIDNANRLVRNQPKFLDLLQDWAKSATDFKIATVVFVSSEGRVPRRMTERSTWSRSGEILEIDDMSKEEAFEFLKLRGLNKEQIRQGYELAGGRIMDLKGVADEIQKGRTFQVIRQQMFLTAEAKLQQAEMLPEGCYHKQGAVVIRELLKNGNISINTYRDLVGFNVGDKLLEGNVFLRHFNSGTVTFQSTVMKRFCEEKPVYWKGT